MVVFGALVLAPALVSTANASLLQIIAGGLDLVYDGSAIYDATTPAGGLTTTTWQTLNPLATYLLSVAISDYVTIHDDTCPITPLRNWIFPVDVARATEDLNRLCEMIEFMEDFARFGVPFLNHLSWVPVSHLASVLLERGDLLLERSPEVVVGFAHSSSQAKRV